MELNLCISGKFPILCKKLKENDRRIIENNNYLKYPIFLYNTNKIIDEITFVRVGLRQNIPTKLVLFQNANIELLTIDKDGKYVLKFKDKIFTLSNNKFETLPKNEIQKYKNLLSVKI